ncbi:MAG: T9SS type A sorting domain-containing protein, partial [Ginsengibacter sp.]
KIFPNPTEGQFTINNIKADDVIVLTEVSGRQMLKTIASGETQQLNISQMAQGLYLITVSRNGKIVVNDKIIKVK